MNAVPRRYRRLLALVVVSLLLHLLAMTFIGRLPSPPAIPAAPRAPLALRLQAAPPPVVRPAFRDARGPAAPAPRASASARAQAAPALSRPTSAADAVPDGSSDTVVEAPPGRYRMEVPASATLDYALTRPDGTQAPVQIAWQTTGMTYKVAADGVTGTVSSTGAIGDTGIEPAQGRMHREDGTEVVAGFTWNGIVIDARPYRKRIGSQDPASMLLQLTAMGLGSQEQLSGTVALHVATADGPVIMQFKVSENEELATPLGTFTTRHLVQVVPAGQARLEVWLAPERNWLPVQLRRTAPDGTASTQAITRIGQADAPPVEP